ERGWKNSPACRSRSCARHGSARSDEGHMAIVNGVHILIYTSNPEADRGFFRDVLGFKYVDVGHGWLIFGLPPAEAAFHPADGAAGQSHAGHAMLGSVVYLMCKDLNATIKALAAKKVACTEVEAEEWGIRTTVKLPSGGELGLYQPTHEVAYDLGTAPAKKKASSTAKRASRRPAKKSRRRRAAPTKRPAPLKGDARPPR